MMNEKNARIAYCGLNCSECPVFLATQADDDAARRKVAEEWSNQFHWDLAPPDINCDGCKDAGGRIFGYCAQCEIRKCGSGKDMDNCASCGEYACEKLQNVFSFSPAIRTALETLRKGLPSV